MFTCSVLQTRKTFW